MLDFRQKFLTGAATGAFILSILATSAFAGSTIHLSAAANSNSDSHSSSNSPFKGFPFVNISFDEFFRDVFNKKLEASMEGANEIPGPGDVDGTGTATVKINRGNNQLCVDIETDYLDQPTAAHIHHAPKGSAGAIVVVLPTPDSNGEAYGCVDVDQNLIKAIKENPEDYYVNVHTTAYPDGAIRGQLSR